MTSNCRCVHAAESSLCICEASAPNTMRETNHRYSFRFIEPGKNIHHRAVWFKHANYPRDQRTQDTQKTTIVGKPKVVRVLLKYVGETDRFQNRGSSLDVNYHASTNVPPNGSTSHLRPNTSQNNAHEKRNGNNAGPELLSKTRIHWISYYPKVRGERKHKRASAGIKDNRKT